MNEIFRADDDLRAAALSGLRVRDLVATSQVASHTASDTTRSWDDVSLSTQDGGDDHDASCTWMLDGNPFLLCDEHLAAYQRVVRVCENARLGERFCDDLDCACIAVERAEYDAARAVPVIPEVQVIASIEDEEAAEREAAMSRYLRTLNMGSWLTSQPRRFPTMRAEFVVAS